MSDEGIYGEQLAGEGIPVHCLNMRPGTLTPTALLRLRLLVRDLRPNVLQGWMYHGNLAASAAGRLAPGRPAVSWNVRHSLYGLESEKPLTRQVIRANRFLSRGVGAILYNSRLSREQHEAFGFSGDYALVIPNGFDLERFRPDAEQRRRQRQALGIPASARVVGHIARFHPMKDHALFLRAAVQVAHQNTDARFLLVGRDVVTANPAFAGIVPGDLADRFMFLGERHDVPELMQAMDVFCQSSWSEAFPNVLGEAMASGIPCIATDVGDSADIVADTGVIVPPRDEEALARGILKMLAKSPGERQSLGLRARERVERNYALPRIVEQYAMLYKRLAEK